MSKPEGERIAVIEVESSAHAEQIEKLTNAVEEISEQLHQIAIQLAKSKSFIAGISCAFSLIGASIAFVANYLMGHK
jgi:hypothetical protein